MRDTYKQKLLIPHEEYKKRQSVQMWNDLGCLGCGPHFRMSSEKWSHTRFEAVEMKPVDKHVRPTKKKKIKNKIQCLCLLSLSLSLSLSL